jgi:hypothetical protein
LETIAITDLFVMPQILPVKKNSDFYFLQQKYSTVDSENLAFLAPPRVKNSVNLKNL